MASDSSQSATRLAATPTTDHCTMKVMRRTVANKLAAYWQVVCQHLGYTPQQFRCESDKKSLIAVLECWVVAGEREGRPKTWPQFISVIADINPSISSEICGSLRNEGVWTAPPTSEAEHTPQVTLLQDRISSLEVTDSGGAIAATSTLSCCSMKVMRKHVVTKLSPHWKAVCHQLSYPPDNFTCGNNKKSVIAVLEKWISVAERGGQPKTWHMFGEEVLSNIDHCVSDAICADLKKNEGICIALPTMKSPDLSVKQQPQLVQDDLSSITEVTDGGITKNGHVQPTNQTAPRVTPPPVERKCDMKTMYKCGVKKLAPYWITVADFLDYGVAEKSSFRCNDNKDSLVAVLENWITTDNGREPKTWSTFAKVLTEVDEDQSISLGHEICVKLLNIGVLPSISPVPNLPPRSSSFSTPPAHHNHRKVLKSAHSFPEYKEAVKATHHQQPLKDIQEKLVFDETLEENTEQSSKAIPEQSYGTPHMPPPHGQNFTSSTTRPPFPSMPGLYHSLSPSYQSLTSSQNYLQGTSSPGYRSTTPSQNFQSVTPFQSYQSMCHSPSYRPMIASQDQLSHAASQIRGSMASLQGHGPMAPPKVGGSIAPSSHHGRSTASLRGRGSMAHLPHHGRLTAPSQGCVSMAHSPHHGRLTVPAQGHGSIASPQDDGSMFSSQDYQSMPSSQDHRLIFSLQGQLSMDTSQGHGSMARSQGHGSMALSQGHGSMAHSQGHGSMARSQGCGSVVPSLGRRLMAPPQDHGSMARSSHYSRPAVPSQDHRFMAPTQDHRSMTSSQGHGLTAPSQGHGSMASSQGHGLMFSSQDFGSINPLQTFPPMNPPQGHPSMPHLQHMSFSQPGDSYMYHSMQHQPRPIHPKYRQYAMQGQPYEPQCDNTSVTMATTKPTAAMTTVTSSTAVINTTASSGVTSSTTSSATSTGSADAHTTTTTGLSYCVHFTQSRVTTQSVSQPTNEKCKAKCTVVEDNVDLSSPINNLSVAKDKMAPQPVPINVNPPTLQTTTNSNVAQASSNNQSTLPATLSPNAADSAVAAPFKWKKGRMLGSGAFGRVFLCTDEDSNRTLAVKEVDIDPNFTNDTIKAVESLEKEIRILKRVKHDHIVQYYGTERSSNCVRIFMEYMEGGSLYHYIDKRGALEEHVASYYTRQLLEGVDYLHIREIIHRDIKGANILMDHKGYIKIADFGASKLLRSLYLSVRRPEVKNTNHKSVAGTAYWMAPEVIRGETVDHGADIWSIGCTVVEMLTCHPPYTHLETWAAMYKIATEPMCYNIPEESSNYVHDFLSQCFISEISERPAASALLKHQFVHISMCNDDVTTDGVVVAASSMASADQRRVIGNRDIDSVISQAPQSETGMDTLTPAMPTVTTITGRNNSSIANNDVQSSSTGKEAILTCIPSQVGLVSDAEGTSSSAVVTGIAASSDQSSSPAGNDDDDTPDDDDVALNDNNFDGDDISKAKAEQKITSDEVHTSATVKPNSNGISSTTVTTTVTTSTTDSATAATNSDGKDGPRYSQVKQVPKKSSNDTANYTPSAGYASNIDDNSTPLKSLSEKTIEPSNGCMQDSEPWKIRQQELQNASNAFVSNIFGNFPPSQNAAAATGGCTIQAVQIVVQGNIVMAPTAPPSSLPIFDHSKITHNSLESFAQDIYSLVDIEIILPWMLKHGLITRADQEYLISQYHTSSMRQQKFMCLVISLNENYVEKFLDCLSQTAVEYVPHDELLKKIRNEKE